MKYIKSNPNEGGGIGHQFMNWFTGLVLAKILDIGFVHTPLIASRSGGDWDEFLNFGEGYPTKQDLNHSVVNLPDLDLGQDVSKKEGRKNLDLLKSKIQSGPDEKIYSLAYNTFPGVLGEKVWVIIDELREKYRKSNKVNDNDRFTVSFHLRRGDINPHQNSNRWIGNHYYIEWIERIRNILVDYGGYGNPKMILFSTTGQTGEFSDFPDYIERRIDGNPYDDFHKMVGSDVLFAGLSSYSILAAALNDNFCFYFPLQTYCDWMEDKECPYKACYSNVYDQSSKKLKRWLDEYR